LGVNRLWPGNPVNRRYRCFDLNPEMAAEVDQPAGAFLAIKRTAWRELGGLDEAFRPVWFEDVDICKRAKEKGYQVYYVPSAAARHSGGHSVGKLPWDRRQGYWYGNLLRYAGKHFGASALAFLCFAVIAGSVSRMVVGLFLWRSARPLSAFARVIRLAGLYLVAGRKRVGLPAAI
jgi:N-acetylglucosaminyl-diphospho-decaprenol L-rhamnosyltransferase